VLDRHVRDYFAAHPIELLPLVDEASMDGRVPGLRLYRIGPRQPGGLWTYVTSGVWAATHEEGVGLEFVLAAPSDDVRYPNLLGSVAYYHAGPPEDWLGLGSIVPIGEPLVEGSECLHFLVSLPYPYGPKLKNCEWDGGHAHFLWLLPITNAERVYANANGLEALEVLFEQSGFEHWNPHRPSVV
jgi:hypothetical protein